MHENEIYRLLAQAGRYLTYHAMQWALATSSAEEEQHRKSIVTQKHRIESLLQGRNVQFPEPWLDLVEMQKRFQACNALPQTDSDQKSDPDYRLRERPSLP